MGGQDAQVGVLTVPGRLQVEVRRRGAGADAWLSALPDIWHQVSARWGLSIAGEPAAGSVSLVVPVCRPGGAAALKLISPTVDAGAEAAALAAFDGHGAVRLLDVDLGRRALLLEWLEGPTLAAESDVATAIATAGTVARQLASTPAPAGVPTLRGGASGWAELLHRQHAVALHGGSAAPEDLFALALTIVGELGRDTTTTLTHGDLSLSNIMRAGPGRWVAIDPQLTAGPVANEAHTVVRSHLPLILAGAGPSGLLHDWTARFCDAAGAEPDQAQRISLARYLASYYWEAQHDGDPANVEKLRRGLFLTANQL